jgi:diguanylate cyclase (GGDEF)-like protein
VADRSANALKQGTTLIRYGGEEFVVALPYVSYADAVKVAWRMQKTLESSLFAINGLEMKITASFGVASKTTDLASLADVINAADKALYKAKHNGKRTVEGFL